MNLSPADDAPRPRAGDGFSDAVTVAFGDARADLYGVARLGLADNGASGLAILFHRGEPVAVRAEGGVETGEPTAWDEVSAAGLDTEVVEPLRAWRLHYASDDASLDLDLRALGAIAVLDRGRPRREDRRHGRLRAGRPRDRGRHRRPASGSRSTPSASAATRGARRTGARSRWRGRWAPGSTTTSRCRSRRSARPARRTTTRRRSPRPSSTATPTPTSRARPPWSTRGCRRPTTPTAARSPPASSSSSTRTASRGAPRARSAAARRSTSAACACTARSSAGGWKAAPGSGATTSWPAREPVSPIEAVVSDFGGVLTTPLIETFAALQEEDRLDQGAMRAALQRITERNGAHPVHELETGRHDRARLPRRSSARSCARISAGTSRCTRSPSATSPTSSRTSR